MRPCDSSVLIRIECETRRMLSGPGPAGAQCSPARRVRARLALSPTLPAPAKGGHRLCQCRRLSGRARGNACVPTPDRLTRAPARVQRAGSHSVAKSRPRLLTRVDGLPLPAATRFTTWTANLTRAPRAAVPHMLQCFKARTCFLVCHQKGMLAGTFPQASTPIDASTGVGKLVAERPTFNGMALAKRILLRQHAPRPRARPACCREVQAALAALRGSVAGAPAVGAGACHEQKAPQLSIAVDREHRAVACDKAHEHYAPRGSPAGVADKAGHSWEDPRRCVNPRKNSAARPLYQVCHLHRYVRDVVKVQRPPPPPFSPPGGGRRAAHH